MSSSCPRQVQQRKGPQRTCVVCKTAPPPHPRLPFLAKGFQVEDDVKDLETESLRLTQVCPSRRRQQHPVVLSAGPGAGLGMHFSVLLLPNCRMLPLLPPEETLACLVQGWRPPCLAALAASEVQALGFHRSPSRLWTGVLLYIAGKQLPLALVLSETLSQWPFPLISPPQSMVGAERGSEMRKRAAGRCTREPERRTPFQGPVSLAFRPQM